MVFVASSILFNTYIYFWSLFYGEFYFILIDLNPVGDYLGETIVIGIPWDI